MRTAARIRRMNDVAFFSHYGAANRAVRFFAEPAGSVAERIFDLHQRHAQFVVTAHEQAIVANARSLAEWSLPADCLLVLAGRSGSEGIELDAHPAVTGASAHPRRPIDARDRSASPGSPPDVRLSVHPDGQAVTLEGWGAIGGVGAKILLTLVEPFREAVRAELAPERYPLMLAKTLAQRSGCPSEKTLRTRILRLRKKLKEFAKTSGRPPLPIDAIIENLSWRGYRLNPSICSARIAPASTGRCRR